MNVSSVAPAAPPPPKAVGQAGYDDQFSEILNEVRQESTDETATTDRPASNSERQPGQHTHTADAPAPHAADNDRAPASADTAGGKSSITTETAEAATTGTQQQAGNQPAAPGQPGTVPAAAAAAADPAQTAGAPNGDAAAGKPTTPTTPTVAGNDAAGTLVAAANTATDKKPAPPSTQAKATPTASAPASSPASAQAQTEALPTAIPDTDAGRVAASATASNHLPGSPTATVPAFAGAPTGNTTGAATAGQTIAAQAVAKGQGQAELPQVQNLAKAELAASAAAGTSHAAAQPSIDAPSGAGGTTPAAGIGATGTSETGGNAQTQATTPSPSRPAANMQGPAMQVAVQIARAAQDGVNQIQVRLNPAELGRVDVKLDVGHDGRVIAVVSADRQETLDMLQRDQRGLERALQDAGLQTNSGGLSFSLRHDGADGQQTAKGQGNAQGDLETDADEAVPAPPASRPDGILDISV